jgi:hypothetical protein
MTRAIAFGNSRFVFAGTCTCKAFVPEKKKGKKKEEASIARVLNTIREEEPQLADDGNPLLQLLREGGRPVPEVEVDVQAGGVFQPRGAMPTATPVVMEMARWKTGSRSMAGSKPKNLTRRLQPCSQGFKAQPSGGAPNGKDIPIKDRVSWYHYNNLAYAIPQTKDRGGQLSTVP